MANEDPQIMLKCFSLSDILKEAKNLLEKLSRQLYVLIDDSNLLHFGRVLSQLEKINKKMLPKLSLILFSSSSTQINLFPKTEIFEINSMNPEQILEILKEQTFQEKGQKLGVDQIAILRSQVSTYKYFTGKFQLQKPENNLIMAQLQCAELLNGELILSANIENFFNSLEQCCGVENFTLVAQLICCAPYGITLLELLNGFRLKKRNSAANFEPDDALSYVPILALINMRMFYKF